MMLGIEPRTFGMSDVCSITALQSPQSRQDLKNKIMCLSMCTTCMPGGLGPERVSDTLELDLQTVVEPPRGCWNSNLIPLEEQQLP